ncbi:MAG: putative transposase, partial [Gaiellaceae bacterium]|nr:putative transposase [Gaiellaceae bacterium]
MLMTQGAPPAEEALLLPSIVQPATAGGSNQGYVVELDSGDEADFKPRNGVKRRIAADYGHDASQAVLYEAIAWRIAREFGHPFDTLVAPCVLRAIDGIDPTSPGGGPSWRDFLRAHAGSIVACDFFTVESVCLRRSYALFFIAHANRRVWPAGCTTNPTGAWVTQQARNLGLEFADKD